MITKSYQEQEQEPPSRSMPLQSDACLFPLREADTFPGVLKEPPFPSVITLPPRPQRRAGEGLIKPSPRSADFRKRFFPAVSASLWSDWRWQSANRIKTLEGLSRFVRVSPDERDALLWPGGPLPMSVTPYYLSLIDPDDPGHALRRCMIPTCAERASSRGEAADPLGEDHDSPSPGLVHRYPDRVLLLATGYCAAYCRYCTRSRAVGDGGTLRPSRARWEKALAYIEGRPEVRDVLISGGDPLTMAEEKLDWLLSRVTRIPHVEFVRIGSKTPAVLPQRITRSLIKMLRKYHPLWLSLHFTHPEELTPECCQALSRLADAGIPLGSQTVLLSGVNDNVDTLTKLYHGLLKNRVRPYYLYQCDPIPGSSHFRTPVSRGLDMISGLRGHTTGYGVPTYVVDAPGGGGKIPLCPDAVVGRENGDLLLRNYEGGVFRYPDASFPAGE